MTKTITGRITLNLVAGILITVVTVVAAIFWMASRQNDQARTSTETMVAGGVEAMKRRTQALANDYGWWEDAYQAYVKGDTDWLDTNVGSSVTETMVADLFAIVSPDGKIVYGWDLDDNRTPEDMLPMDVVEAVRALAKDMPVESLAARGALIRVGPEPMVIAVSHIVPFLTDPNADPATLPLFIAGIKLTNERLVDLGKTFLIDDLHFELSEEPTGTAYVSSLPALDIFGKTIGYYAWTPPAPGDAALRNVLPPVTVALVLFCIVAFVTAYRARKMAMALAESEQEAVVAARTDSMTSLKNRTGFNELLDSQSYLEACGLGQLAIVYMDINGFKAVNDFDRPPRRRRAGQGLVEPGALRTAPRGGLRPDRRRRVRHRADRRGGARRRRGSCLRRCPLPRPAVHRPRLRIPCDAPRSAMRSPVASA